MLKKRTWIIVLIGLASCLMLLLTGCRKVDKVIFTVNGTSIKETEIQLAMSHVRSDIILYFTQEYGETDFSDAFWNKQYGDDKKTPIEVLKETAVAELVEKHVVLAAAKDKGLIATDDFSGIQEEYQKENAFRKEQVQNGEVIYGVQAFGIWEYYDWLVSNCTMELRNLEIRDISDDEIMKYYEEHKDEIAMTDAVLNCREYKVSMGQYEDDAESMAGKIFENLTNGFAFDEAGIEYGLVAEEKIYYMSAEKGLSVLLPELAKTLKQLKEGEPQLVAEQGEYYIIVLDSKKEAEYQTVEQVASKIETLLAQERVDSKIKEDVLHAKVEKTKRYEEIRMED